MDIALELLNVELARLMRDHYADGKDNTCDGCERAFQVTREINAIQALKEANSAAD